MGISVRLLTSFPLLRKRWCRGLFCFNFIFHCSKKCFICFSLFYQFFVMALNILEF